MTVPASDRAARPAEATASPRRRWAGLVFISVAVALIIVDSTIINVAIPSIVDDLAITSTKVQWVQESYTLVFAALLLVFGTLADRYGRRRIMLLGVVVFAAASVLAAFSGSGDLLIGARLVQGVGGAMVLPTTLSLINATFRGRDRGIAFAIWGSTIGGMVAVGPLLGGWLTTYFSWRWAFGINVPLGIIIVIGVLTFVVESRDAGEPRRVDVVGATRNSPTSPASRRPRSPRSSTPSWTVPVRPSLRSRPGTRPSRMPRGRRSARAPGTPPSPPPVSSCSASWPRCGSPELLRTGMPEKRMPPPPESAVPPRSTRRDRAARWATRQARFRRGRRSRTRAAPARMSAAAAAAPPRSTPVGARCGFPGTAGAAGPGWAGAAAGAITME